MFYVYDADGHREYFDSEHSRYTVNRNGPLVVVEGTWRTTYSPYAWTRIEEPVIHLPDPWASDGSDDVIPDDSDEHDQSPFG